jgi:hypothetical protein
MVILESNVPPVEVPLNVTVPEEEVESGCGSVLVEIFPPELFTVT